MSTNRIWALVLVVAVACSTAALADGITVYNNFGPGNDGFEVYTGWSWMIAGVGSGFDPVQNAQWFSPSDSGPLSDIYIALRRVIPPYKDMFVRLCANNNFEPPTEANVVEEWLVNPATLPFAGSQGAPAHLVSALQPTLEAGQSYVIWVGFDNNGNGAWAPNIFNEYVPRRQRTYEYSGWQWQPLGDARAGALRVDIVPEPASLALLLCGLLTVVRRR
jgi:hypothetical protein